jgi:hypothetical protein
MQHDNDPQPRRGARSFLIPVLIFVVVVVFVLLHVAGVFGPASN